MLHHRVTGNPAGPVILFLHGFMGSGQEWQEVTQPLHQEFRCITVDLPGHGASLALPEEAYAIAGAAAAIDRLLDELSIDQCSIVGYSMGGRVALYFALHYPQRCARLVLESATPGIQSEVEREARRGMDEARAVRLETGPYEHFLDEWYSQPLFSTLAANPAVLEQVKKSRLENKPAELAKSLRSLSVAAQPPLWEKLSDLHVPTLVIAGALDGKYVEVTERMKLLGSHVRPAVFPNTGHNVHLEHPSEYADLLRDFLDVTK